jgi:hypothetical protein
LEHDVVGKIKIQQFKEPSFQAKKDFLWRTENLDGCFNSYVQNVPVF